MAFSEGVHWNVLVEQTQSNGSYAISISLFFLFTSTRCMFTEHRLLLEIFPVCLVHQSLIMIFLACFTYFEALRDTFYNTIIQYDNFI